MKVFQFYGISQVMCLLLHFQLTIQTQCPSLNQISNDLIKQINVENESHIHFSPVKIGASYLLWKIGSGAKIFLQHGCSNVVPNKLTSLKWIKDKQFVILSSVYLLGRATSISLSVSCVRQVFHNLNNLVTYKRTDSFDIVWEDYNLTKANDISNLIDMKVSEELEDLGYHIVDVVKGEDPVFVMIPIVGHGDVGIFLTETTMINEVLSGYVSYKKDRMSIAGTTSKTWWMLYEGSSSGITWNLYEASDTTTQEYNDNWCIGM